MTRKPPPESERGISLSFSQSCAVDHLCSFSLPPALGITRPSSPSSRVILFVPYLSVRLHLQDAVISLARLDVYCEAEIENGL